MRVSLDRLGFVVSLASLCLLAAPAKAAHASGSEPTAADKDTARTLMVRGLEQRQSGALDDALKSFRAADAIMHVPTTAVEVARTLQAGGHWVEAREVAIAALRLPAKPLESGPFKEARTQMNALVDDLGARIPSLIVHVINLPPGGVPTVTLDGHDLPVATLDVPRKVDPGHHVLDASTSSTVAHTEVDVRERQTATAQLVLAAPEGGSARVDSAAAGHARPLIIGEIGGFALGGVGLATGILTGVVSLSKTHSVRSACGGDHCPANIYDSSSLQSERSQAQTFGTVSTVSLIVAGAATAVGVTCLVLRSRSASPSAKTPAISWQLTPSGFAAKF